MAASGPGASGAPDDADLGYRVLFALDATDTFDEVTSDGRLVTAEEFTAVTAANLDGHFATVLSTTAVLARESEGAVAGFTPP